MPNCIFEVWGLVNKLHQIGGDSSGRNCIECLPFISDRRILLVVGIPLCKSRELSRKEHSVSQLCIIRQDIRVCQTAHARSIWSMVSVWPQLWQTVGCPRDKIWDFVALVWPVRSWVIANYSALVKCWNFVGGPSISRGRDLCHVQLHPTSFEPTAGCRSWPLALNLYYGRLPVGLCLGQW